ncbi:MAG TPA: type I-U CRISPR-associated helicase/endonuclease Cas3 [Kofleriaceae bacterium]|nr:type I-U CRISPR-associated helicase/endonuclease Cas3 [Kofleriaceae bacterium]
MTALASFEEVFVAAGMAASAFPWQRRLVDQVLAEGWPDALALPTGVGKTSALDIALYCLAAAPDRMPRRVVLVVDRRVVVDQGAARARALQRALAAATTGPLAGLADRLRALWDGPRDEPPFAVAVMRGGMPRDHDWARRPDQPVLGVSTVDQLGSRLLFRGYGVSPRAAAIHAGLLGNDTLILLDEVHLAQAFAETLHHVGRYRQRRDAAVRIPDRWHVVQMSATLRQPGARPPFTLDAEDRAHPVLRPRLTARKPAALGLVKLTGDDEARKRAALAERAVSAALALQAAGARVVAIVVNRVDTARLAHRALAGHRATTDAVLVTGRMRPIERDHAVRDKLARVTGGRARGADEPALIVVATQCIEAGADFDFDAIVTECASLDALRQRFGRVDRRGACATAATSVILGRSDQLAASAGPDPVYGAALAATWRWLEAHATDGVIDFGLSALPAAIGPDGEPRADLLPASPAVPVLLPAHLDAWAQTSQPLDADPEIAMWLHGDVELARDVQVVWRVGAGLDPDDVIDQLHACRPSALEAVTVPLAALRRWLTAQAAAPDDALADVEGERASEVAPHGPARWVVRWDGDDSAAIDVNARDVRPGDVIVVDAAGGGLRDDSFDPASRAPVLDLGDLAQLRGRGVASLRLSRAALAVWRFPAAMLDAIPAPQPDESLTELRDRIKLWLAGWPATAPDGFLGTAEEWRAARTALQRAPRVQLVAGLVVITAPGTLRGTYELDDAVSEDDASSFRQREITLAAHSHDVRTRAERFARALGCAAELSADLGLAAWLHDVGKADPRFQRWLVGGDEIDEAMADAPLAKSRLATGDARARRLARARAGYPAGGRHELMSVALVQDHAALREAHDPELVLHLIASHHGWCRPFPPPVVDPAAIAVRLQHGPHVLAASTQHGLTRLDSGLADRFWRLGARYGWWGLAWLEAVLRLADHRASEIGGSP